MNGGRRWGRNFRAAIRRRLAAGQMMVIRQPAGQANSRLGVQARLVVEDGQRCAAGLTARNTARASCLPG
jgi:hypothetical protein